MRGGWQGRGIRDPGGNRPVVDVDSIGSHTNYRYCYEGFFAATPD